MNRLELRHIRVIVAIARAGSIRAAAAGLRVAQPALVAQLQRIEHAAGGPLFTRTRTGVEPTERGRRLVDDGAALVDDFDRLIADTTARAAESARVGALGVGSMRALDSPTLIAALDELLPDVETETRQLDTLSEGLALLGSGELDIALLYRFDVPLPAGMHQRDVVAVEPAFVGLPADHPLADRPEIALTDLAGAHWVISGADDGTGRLTGFRAACAAAGFAPRIRHRVGDCDGAIALLRTSAVVAVMSPMCLPPDGVVIRPLAGAPHFRTITLVWRPGSAVEPVADEVHRRLVAAYHVEVGLRPHYKRWWSGPLTALPPPGMTAPRCVTSPR